MTEKDKKRLLYLASKLESLKLLDVIGSTIHSKSVSQEQFDAAMRESEVGLMSVFGCNTSNYVRNAERKVGQSTPTLDEVNELVTEITSIINKGRE